VSSYSRTQGNVTSPLSPASPNRWLSLFGAVRRHYIEAPWKRERERERERKREGERDKEKQKEKQRKREREREGERERERERACCVCAEQGPTSRPRRLLAPK
jgi:hypothetical protein